jgi:hypothetical protein
MQHEKHTPILDVQVMGLQQQQQQLCQLHWPAGNGTRTASSSSSSSSRIECCMNARRYLLHVTCRLFAAVPLRSELCNPAKQPPPFRGYAMCTAAQTAAVIERLKQEPDFQKLNNFTPCALYRYLKGRTLWVMG